MTSENTKNFLEEVEKLLGESLNRKADLQTIFELSAQFKLEKNFEELVFNGKYLNGLMKVLKSGPGIPEVESLEHIKKDLAIKMETLISQIREIVSKSDEATMSFFENNYLQLSQQNLLNLNSLIEDLDRIKKYLNFKKRTN
ncbi:MAG TPA: hypothetical protein VI362_08415 [Ignavibacteriaceae bacterium]|nr:hypothetical protein [Ignavibacteriaceae bacterium]